MTIHRSVVIASLFITCLTLSACASTAGGQDSNVRVDPHHGQEWEHGMAAAVDVIRPFSKVKDAVEFENRAGAMKGYGALLDLLSR